MNEKMKLDKLHKLAELKAMGDDIKRSTPLSTEGTQKLLHELRLHQIELEMQNDDLRNTERQLQTLQTRYFDLYNFAPVGYFTLNIKNEILDSNLKAPTLLGVEKGAIINQPFTNFINPEPVDQDVYYINRKMLLETGTQQSFELRLLKDATAFWAQLDISQMSNTDGDGNILVIAIDITERKRIEDALRESEGRYRTLADSGQALIWTAGLDKKCDYFNIPWLVFTGKRIEDELGDGWAKGVYPDDLLRCFDIYVNAFDRRVKFSMNYRIQHNSGEYRWIQDDGTPRYNSKGEFIGYIGHCLDITDRIRTEEILHTTQKLESLGVLAGGIAHDFNNLMGGIFGYIDMASEASTENKVTSYLSKAMNTIDRARALTLQLLTFAKGGAPIQEIGYLFPLVEETAKFALSGANVSCHVDVQQDLWACNFDKNQIGQVIDNLIINAQQAMPVGGTIELTARNITLSEKEHALLTTGNYVRIAIKDTGIGISKELIAKIFDPFFTTKPKGHGLGLATCYSIIKRHEGCMDVESELGKGTTFTIFLPASTEAASSVAVNTKKTHKGSGIFLIMDDEEVMRDTIKKMLECLGYTVVSKGNGKDAIDFFASETKENRKITGMIFDLTVPGGMGGKAAIAEIRKINRVIPAFVASGYADDPVMKKPAEHGFTASICKPFRKSELSEMLDKYMQMKN